MAGLTRAATELEKPTPIQIVQLEEISDVLPVLALRSDGLIRYLGQSQAVFGASGATIPSAHQACNATPSTARTRHIRTRAATSSIEAPTRAGASRDEQAVSILLKLVHQFALAEIAILENILDISGMRS